MLGIIGPKEMRLRRITAFLVAAVIVTTFSVLFRYIWKLFSPARIEGELTKKRWQFSKYKIAYLCLAPALISIALWKYYPLARGAVMAFQDYRVTGGSKFIFLDNFANVLWDGTFWYSMAITIKYAFVFLLFGFCAPIVLVLLLQEIPRGKILYRTIYYLPAVISLVVVAFLWKSFYLSEGLLNQILQAVGVDSHINWLQQPKLALLCCIAPVIWIGMGPGCLIYLAALKTVPNEYYEAADIDGASIWQKIAHITLPSIKALIVINFIGAFIGAFQSANLMFAMTGGGPHTSSGGATEVIGLKIFYTSFMYLKFGLATAMAWILGLMLIGFTVIQLRKLRFMEFRAVGSS